MIQPAPQTTRERLDKANAVTVAQSRRRLLAIGTFGILAVVLVLSHSNITWRGDEQLHTLQEVSAALIGLIAGVIAVMRYLARPSIRFLFIGAALVGAAALDAYHAGITSSYLKQYMPTSQADLISWSWSTSRFYFATLILAGLVMEARLVNATKEQIAVHARWVLFGVVTFFITCFVLFQVLPLPRGYFPDLFFHRPQEFVPGALLIGALIVSLRKSSLSYDPFDDWFIVSLVLGIFTQVAFMPLSQSIFDADFDLAHLLKTASYAAILAGLMASTYTVLRQEKKNAALIADLSDDLQQHIRLAYHDLREPLRGMMNLADWLEEDLGSSLNHKSRQYLDLLKARITRMDMLVVGFRDYARAADVHSSLSQMNASAKIREIFADVNSQAGFRLVFGSGLPTILSDANGFPIVIACLLKNAIRHHDRESGTIRVEAVDRDDFYEFRVTDDGPGIPPAFHKTAFNAFETLQPRDNRECAGVGLAIARRIITRFGGAIGIEEAKTVNKRGTTVWFTWPKHPAEINLPKSVKTDSDYANAFSVAPVKVT